jgi:mono/diheme cytochrome c family protein
MDQQKKILIALSLILLVVGVATWYRIYRDVPQPQWIVADQRDDFLYGSVADSTAGMPYWIWLVLPRMFKEYLPGPGGYASLGLSWEEGNEMPVGFSKKTTGYVRVAGNCALCHAASYRKEPDEAPEVVAVVGALPGHAVNVRRLLTFFAKCAADPRFNADEILAEIDMATKLSFLDRLLYRYVLVPRTKKALLDGNVLLDSALRLHADDPHSDATFSREQTKALGKWLKALNPQPYPLSVEPALAADGKPVFVQHCGSCHAPGGTGNRMGTVIPIAEIGTDRERPERWTRPTDGANTTMASISGYLAAPLDGVWLRGPYLHNGSVPTIRALLEPQSRPRTFYRGNDLIDTRNVGFVSTLPHEMGRQFLLYDTSEPGHRNSGHLYGTSLSRSEKDALLEYLKTL